MEHHVYDFVVLHRDSDYGNQEMIDSMKEEKKRKQMEAIAEDLFNNEKVINFELFILLQWDKSLRDYNKVQGMALCDGKITPVMTWSHRFKPRNNLSAK